jgi:hypothetical protein
LLHRKRTPRFHVFSSYVAIFRGAIRILKANNHD